MAYHFVDPKELSTPKSGMFEVKVNEWWMVDMAGNLVFYSFRSNSSSLTHPQCNPDERITRLQAKVYEGWFEVKQIPLIFLPHNCSDYYG